MNGSTPPNLTIAEAGRLIAAKRLSPVELVKDLLARIETTDPKLNSFLLVTERQALAAARAAERAVMSGRRSPLLGIPVAYKDIYETAGVRTTAHSRILAENIPKDDAETVHRLSAEGAVMLGKLATHEFAIGGPAFDLVTDSHVNGQIGTNTPADDSFTFTAGATYDLGQIKWTFQTAYTTSAPWAKESVNIYNVRPSVLWYVPRRYTFNSRTQWIVGFGVRGTWGPDGFEISQSSRVRAEITFRQVMDKLRDVTGTK